MNPTYNPQQQAAGAGTYRWNPYGAQPTMGYAPTPQVAPPQIPAVQVPVSVPPPQPTVVHDQPQMTEAWVVIASLRAEKKDATVEDRVATMTDSEVAALTTALLSRPDVIADMCYRERGNIIAPLVARLGPVDSMPLFDALMASAMSISTAQSGCIAMTRLYDAAAPEQRKVIDTFCLANLDQLVLHEFGNYVVQRVIEAGDDETMPALLGRIGHVQVITPLAGTKAGSHVLEKFFKAAAEQHVLVLIRILVSDATVLAHLAHDKVGNYVLQACLRRLALLAATSPEALGVFEESSSRVLAAAANSRFLPNIKRSLMGQQTGRGNKFQASNFVPPHVNSATANSSFVGHAY